MPQRPLPTVDDGRPKRALCDRCKERERIKGLKTCGVCVDLTPKEAPAQVMCERCHNKPPREKFKYCPACCAIVYCAD